MIKVTNLHKSFGSNHVLTGIDEVINDGEVVSIIGPSGSGKSTFLRCLNLLETPNEGVIEFDDEVVYIREAYGVKEGDLLFARQSLVLEGAGKCSWIKEVSEYTTFESHLIRVRLNPDVAVSLFYYYYFNSPQSPIKSIV